MNKFSTFIIFTLPFINIFAENKESPNFIIISIDDLGYSDLEPYNVNINKTPYIQQFANEGIVFKSFYSASSLSSPSRAGLLTGCYPQRIGMGKGANEESVLFPADSIGINPSEITLAERLKSIGYSTACIGKWHLGDQPEFMPLNHGFDYYFGIPYSHDMWPKHENRKFPPLPLIRNSEIVDTISTIDKQSELCDLLTNEAVTYINQHKDSPFFLYLAHNFVHRPHYPKKEYRDMSINPDKDKGGLVVNIDKSVGEIIQTLKKNHIDQHTIVWLISDNGGIKNSNLPLKGWKGSFYEGGYRVASIVRWPGKIHPQTDNYDIVSALDIYPTFCSLAGIEKLDGNKIDGIDLHHYLLSKGAKSPRNSVYYYVHNSLKAVRLGKWKLLFDGTLYDMDNDFCEKRDVSKQYPKVVKQISEIMTKVRYDLGDEKMRIAGREVRPSGYKDKNLKFIIPGRDEKGILRYYWKSLNDRKIIFK